MEGIGDECFYFFLTFFFFIIFILYESLKNHTYVGTVHQDNDNFVEIVRTELNQNSPTSSSFIFDQCCPICLTNTSYPIKTNCGHIFCGRCILTYWNVGRWNGAVKCPSCRQLVTILLKNFETSDINSNDSEFRILINDINQYNHRFSGQSVGFLDYLNDMPTIIQYCWNDLINGRLANDIRVRVLISIASFVLYVLLPWDLLPEAALGTSGFLDDLFTGLMLLFYVTSLYRNSIAALAF